MAMIYQAREIHSNGPTGRWRYVGMSDEGSSIDECCDCAGGHATPDEATACQKAKARADHVFGRDKAALEARRDRLRRDLDEVEAMIATAL